MLLLFGPAPARLQVRASRRRSDAVYW